MLSPEKLFKMFAKNKIEFFTGVPDSLLKDFCAFVTDKVSPEKHIIAANEGNAVAMAIGFYLATSKFGLIYLQNSGLGNALNPLISLADPNVYSIPLLLLIGWRGEEGVSDEPQHKKQGTITLSLLETIGIPYMILPETQKEAERAVGQACATMKNRLTPYALVVKSGTFAPYEYKEKTNSSVFSLGREEALKVVMDILSKDTVIVSTTGKLSRELFELRSMKKDGHSHDFLTVGGMGHASSIALGIALSKPKRKVYCLDGDGAAIMHLGACGVIGQLAPSNFRHIIFNNIAHDSVGGQPTAAATMDFLSIVKACGYKQVFRAETINDIELNLKKMEKSMGPAFLEIRVAPGARKNLGRPTRSPVENKNDFMSFLYEGE